jgi:hypothetical protein
MENIKSNTEQNLGIVTIITAIVTFVFAVIPCIGLIAIIPGIIAIVLGIVGLSQVSRNNSANGLSIAGLIIAIIACLISVSQIFVAGAIIRKSGVDGLQNVVNEIKTEVMRGLENENISIRIEKDGERVEIDGNSIEININKDRQKILEELEEASSRHDTLQGN